MTALCKLTMLTGPGRTAAAPGRTAAAPKESHQSYLLGFGARGWGAEGTGQILNLLLNLHIMKCVLTHFEPAHIYGSLYRPKSDQVLQLDG